MKQLILVLGLSLFPLNLKSEELPAFSFKNLFNFTEKAIEILKQEKPSLKVRTTAYTHGESDHIKYGRKTALGTKLKFGKVRSAAADWSVFPVGTQFRIKGSPGILYEVDDYGGALVGTKTIDLYKPSFRAMNKWGVKYIEIKIVKWGSFEKGLKVLKPRMKYSHIRKMVASIKKKGNNEKERMTVLLKKHNYNKSTSKENG